MNNLNAADRIEDIAIVGMSCRFPGAKDIEQFWQNLRNGVESITFFSDQELTESGIDSSIINDSNYIKAGYIVDDIDLFDNSFFGYSPKETEIIDPQQRFFLECAWEALEDATYVPQTYKGLIGIFGGVRISGYVQRMTSDLNRTGTAESFQALIGNDKDYLTTRISYKLNLKGPSVTVQTACSTSLVAVHMASESLRNEECDMALAGGAAIFVPQKRGYFYQEGMIFSSDGHCRAFDAKADGMVAGNGIGVVLLKRLSNALEDGDHIYAVIKGSAVNNDGWSKVGYTAPSLDGQTAVISEALATTDVEAETVTYIETHGTGTFLGDPIEVEALTRVFRAETDKKGFCAIGSVKTNIGHVDMAAGVAGLIKTALALKYKELPPSLNFENPNPRIDFSNSPFFVNTELSVWKTNGHPRRAGVSSFGVGGTNAHVVLEEAPITEPAPHGVERPLHIMTLSAQSENALKELARRYENFLETHLDALLSDLCFTTNVGRSHFPYRLAITAESTEQLNKQIAAFTDGKTPAGLVSGHVQRETKPKVAFLFTGQGSQYFKMGYKLYETQPTFRKAIDRCAGILENHLDRPLLPIIFGEKDDPSVLGKTVYAQPAIFAIEYALAEMWRSWGIEPSVVMGHSVGEYVAACVAGVFSLEDGLKLIAACSRLIQALPQKGEMVAVFAGEERVAAAVAPYANDVSIAVINGPNNVVISGVRKSVRKILDNLTSEGIRAVQLKVSHAFHSPLMEPMLSPFEKIAAEVEYSPPRIELISNLTGRMVKGDEICEDGYWIRHTREPVRFSLAMEELYEKRYNLFLEIGPGPVLLKMGRRCLPDGFGLWLPSIRKGRDDWGQILETLGELYVHGVNVNWAGFDQDYSRNRISLPTYPFERKSFWIKKVPVELREIVATGKKIWDSLFKAGASQAEQGISKLDLKNIIELENFSGMVSANYAGLALRKLGAFLNPDEWFSVDKLLNHFSILHRYQQLLIRLLEGLVQYEQLSKKEVDGKNVYGKLLTTQDSLDKLIKKSKTLSTDLTGLMDFAGSCGGNLADILIGEKDPIKVIFKAAGGTFDMEKFYGKDSYISYFNDIFIEIFQSIIRSVPSDRHLRILEIGAGTGATASFLFPLLSQNKRKTTYMFTDISPMFLNRSEKTFGKYPFVQYKLLDIQENPENQGFNNNSFDVVIAANVLFLTRDLRESLQYVHSLLAPGGILMIRETTKNKIFYDANLGSLLPVLKDEPIRKGWPYLSKTKWKELLKWYNFDEVVAFPESDSEEKALGISIIVAYATSNEEVSASYAFTAPAQTKEGGTEYEMASLSPGPETKTTTNPLLGRRLRSAIPVFEAKLDPHLIPYLMEHKFFGQPIAAVSVFVQMIEQGARQIFGTDSITIKEFSLSSPLIFSGGRSQTVQLFFIYEAAAEASFRVYRHSNNKDEWNLIVSGKVCVSQTNEDKTHLLVDEVQKRCQDIITGVEYDNFMKKIGFEALSGIQTFWRRDGECLGEVYLPETLKSEAAVYRVHPVMMDSCLQVWGPSLPELYQYLKKSDIEEEIDMNEVSLTVPVKIDHIKFYKSTLPNRLWSHTVLRQEDEDLIVDYHIFDQDGVLVGEVIGAHQTNMPRQVIERNLRSDSSTQPIDEAPSPESIKLLNQIRNSSQDQQIDLLQDYLKRTVIYLLRLGDNDILVDKNLIELGLDSLLFLNLAQAIGRDLQVNISFQEVFKDLTIVSLSNQLADHISGESDTNTLDIVNIVGEIVPDEENRYLPFPLTDIQYAYWIGRSGFLKWGNVPCHAYLEFEKEGFDLQSLDRFNLAWQRVIERHDMLRAIILPDGQQQILEKVPQYEIKISDLQGQDSKSVASQLDAIRKEMEGQDLNVNEWPPFEIRAVLFDNDRVRLHFSLDLLIFDPMSLQIMWRDLDRFYRNSEIELEPLELSFRDYILAESKVKDSELYEKSREYWVNHLSTLYPAPELPLVIDPGKLVKPKFTDRTFYLDPDNWDKLKTKAYEADLTPSSLLMSAYVEVLSLWSKNPCFTINVTHFNRQPLHPQVNEIIGDFTSVLLLATDNRDRVPFMERAQNIQKKLWEGMEHRYFSGVQVLRELGQKKGSGPVFMPIVFTSLISLGDRFGSDPDDPELSIMGDIIYTSGQTPQVMLDNQIQLRGDTLAVNWESVDDFFPPGLMDDMFNAYYNLIRRLTGDESTRWE
jgi:acyl transferase domain-containing protein/2-polyprenyl-3-methyl-5-hydroxy-6-metoxy-1,4-benzoquinol methylase